jgi:hypothetical protein
MQLNQSPAMVNHYPCSRLSPSAPTVQTTGSELPSLVVTMGDPHRWTDAAADFQNGELVHVMGPTSPSTVIAIKA